MKKYLLVFFLLMTTALLHAQDSLVPHRNFRVGTRVALGASRFSGINNMKMESDAALQLGLIAARRYENWFSLEMHPALSLLRGRVRGVDNDSAQNSYIDYYRLYNIELPVLAVVRGGNGPLKLKGFIGPVVGFNVYGTRSRSYGDPAYNEQAGYNRQVLNDLEPVTFSGLAGAGLEWETRQGIFGADIRYYEPFTKSGIINAERFSVYAATIGVYWMY